MILQQAEPDDYVLATGETHSVREFVEKAFARSEREIEWRGRASTKRASTRTGQVLCRGRSALFPADRGRSSAGRRIARRVSELGWRHKITFDELVSEMVRPTSTQSAAKSAQRVIDTS